MRLTNKRLQAILTALAEHHSEIQLLMNKIESHCLEVYGVCPWDVDNDDFIDACGGGCGRSGGMTVKEFDESMKEKLKNA